MIWSTRERNCELAVPESSRFIACSIPVADCSTGLMYPVTGAQIEASVYWRCQL